MVSIIAILTLMSIMIRPFRLDETRIALVHPQGYIPENVTEGQYLQYLAYYDIVGHAPTRCPDPLFGRGEESAAGL